MASNFKNLPIDVGNGPAAGVDTFNGRDGVVVAEADDYAADLVSFDPTVEILSTDVQAAIEEISNYIPADAADWDGSPTTIKEAVDRIAALLKILNGGDPVP